MKKNYSYIILFLSCFTVNAQYWTKQHFNVEDGLPDNYTYAIEKFQDEIYVATDGGLVTLTGKNFKIHSKKELRYPVSLLNHKDSIFYVGSWLDGIVKKEKSALRVIYPSRINRILKSDQKSLIFNTYQRLAFLAFNEQQQLDTLIALDSVNKLRRVAIDDDAIYISQGRKILQYNWSGKQTQVFEHQATTAVEAISSLHGYIFYGDSDGNLWWSSKLHPAQANRHRFEKIYTIKHIVAYGEQQIIVQLNHRAEYNSLYVLTFNDSFSKIISSEEILALKNGISDIFTDRETIYVATYGDGFYKLFPSILKAYDKVDYQIPTPKFSYENKQGNMVFATENVSYTLQEKDSFTQQKNPFRFNTIFKFEGKRYFSSHDHLYNENFQKIAETRMDNFFYAKEKDTLFYSKYWFSRYHNSNRENMYCIEFNPEDKKINIGINFQDTIFLGTQNGVRKFVKNPVGLYENWHDAILEKNFKKRVIRNILKYKNQLLIATPYELYNYNGTSVLPLVFTDEDIHINATFVTKNQHIYVGTNKGFWILTDSFQYHFNTKNGTNSDNIYSFYEDTKGLIWMITGNGILALNPALLDVTIPPIITIKKSVIDNDHASISIADNIRNFTEAVLFEYKINNADWKKLNTKELEMSNLKPGNYAVSFRGKRINSEWSVPQTMQFSIVPKWYQLTVIKIFSFGAVTLLLLGFLWIRLRVIKRRNETLSNEINKRIFLEYKVAHLREEIARDFHDEIGNKIASVIGLSNNLKHSETVTSPKIDKIASLSKEIYHTAKDFVWSLNPKNNNIESLCKYLRDYGENFFDLFDEIDFLYLEIDIIPIDISYVKSRNIILAYKEILANIIKHSQATKVVLKAYLEGEKFTIKIQDNGIGFDTITSTQGNGLKNIQKRMEMIKADMEVKKENGVSYLFTLDLKEELNNQNEIP